MKETTGEWSRAAQDQMKDFGAWLRAQRTLQQLSIDEACKRADVSRDRWGRVGRRQPSAPRCW